MTIAKLSLAGLAASAAVMVAQTSPPPRGMQSQVFLEMRTQAQAKAAPAPAPAAPKQTKTAPKAPAPSASAQQLGDSFLGVNLWRMKPADAASPVKVRGLKHRTDPGGTRDWTPERVDFAHQFAEDEHVRVSLESAREGYLYVVNRDVFADGSKSAPTLIFPTKRIRGGNNRVQPGVPVELPEFTDNPPTFHVEQLLPNQTAIELLMVVAPRPIAGFAIPEDEVMLPEATVAAWERQWGTQVELTEDRSLIGRAYTMAEKNAATEPGKPLGANDAVPLALFYRKGAPADPMLAKVLIRVVARR